MSINALANAAVARRLDFRPHNRAPANWVEIASAQAAMPSVSQCPATQTRQEAAAAFSVIVGYVPTEIVTLYVPVIGALGADQKNSNSDDGKQNRTPSDVDYRTVSFRLSASSHCWSTHRVLDILDLHSLRGVARVRTQIEKSGDANSISPWLLALWEAFAATSSFFVWALTLASNPFAAHITQRLAAVLVLVVSTALGLFAPVFQRKIL